MGGMTSSSTTSTPKIPGYVKGLYKDVYKDVNGAYNKFSSKGMPVFSEPTNAALTDQQTSALGGMMNTANANSGGAGMSGPLQQIMSNGGFNQGQMDAMSSIKNLTNNPLMNELINSKNGFTGEQDKAYQGLQGSVYGNNQALQSNFNRGGFDKNQQAAYTGLNNTVQGNNAALQNTFNRDGLNADQSGAMAGLKSTVGQNNAAFQNLFNQSGLTGDMSTAMAGIKDTVLPNNQQFQNTIQQGGLSADQQAVQDRNRGIMNSSFDLNSNPAYASVRQNALNTQADALAGRAAAAGRYGSGTDQAILAREQGKLGGQMDYNEYQIWQNQGNQAANNLYSGAQTGVGNQVTLGQAQQSGLGALAGLSQQGVGNQFNANSAQQAGQNAVAQLGQMGLNNQQNINQNQQSGYSNLGSFGQIGQGNQLAQNSAIQSGLNNIVNTGGQGVTQNSNAIGQKAGLEAQLFNMNQAGLNNMGQAYDTAQKPYQTQMGVGNILQQQAQNTINDKMRMFDAQNPMNAYQQFLGLASGMPTGTTQTTQPSTLQMLLGGGLGTMGLLGGMGAI